MSTVKLTWEHRQQQTAIVSEARIREVAAGQGRPVASPEFREACVQWVKDNNHQMPDWDSLPAGTIATNCKGRIAVKGGNGKWYGGASTSCTGRMPVNNYLPYTLELPEGAPEQQTASVQTNRRPGPGSILRFSLGESEHDKLRFVTLDGRLIDVEGNQRNSSGLWSIGRSYTVLWEAP